MRLTVDRLENDMVFCETPEQKILALPVSQFEFSVKDGDIVDYDGTRAVLLKDLTRARKEEMQSRFASLLKKKPSCEEHT